jgi:hypothetical protein
VIHDEATAAQWRDNNINTQVSMDRTSIHCGQNPKKVDRGRSNMPPCASLYLHGIVVGLNLCPSIMKAVTVHLVGVTAGTRIDTEAPY